MRDGVAHPAYLPVAAFANDELEHRLRAALAGHHAQLPDARRQRAASVDRHAAP